MFVTINMCELTADRASGYHRGDSATGWRRGGAWLQGEEHLVLGAREGDLTAFGEIYEAYFSRVFRYIFTRIGNRAEAEDLAGDVFLKALQAIGSYKPTAPFSAWLFRIAPNLVVDHLRRRSRRQTEELDEELSLATPAPDDQVVTQMTLADVTSAMAV